MRRGAARHGPGARGDRALARAERAPDVLPRRPAAAAPGAARRHAARRARHARRVRRVRRAQVPDVHGPHLRPVPAQLQRLGRGGAVVLLDRAVRACCCSARRACAAARTTRASARACAGRLTRYRLGQGDARRCSLVVRGRRRRSASASRSGRSSTGSPQSSTAGLAGASANVRYLLAGDRSRRSGSASPRRSLALVFALPVALLVVRYRGTARRRCSSAPPTCRSRSPTSSRRSRSRTPRATTRRACTAASRCSCSPRRCCSCRSRSSRCARRSGRSSPRWRTPRARSASGRCARSARVTMPLARPGLAAAGVLVFAFVARRPRHRPGAAAARTCTRSEPSSRRTARRVAFAAAAPFAAVLVALSMLAAYRADEPLRPRSRARERLSMAELRCAGLAKSYGGRVVLRDVDLDVPDGDADGDPRRVGERQDDAAARDHRLHRARRGDRHGRRRDRRRRRRACTSPRTSARSATSPRKARCSRTSRAGENVGFGLARSRAQARRPDRRGARARRARRRATPSARRTSSPAASSGAWRSRERSLRARGIVLLDEPFSGLDAALRVETREAVLHALAEEGTTALLVTHDQAEALSMGREVAVLREGRLVQRAAPTALYRTPVDPDVARFVGEAIVLAGRRAARRQVRCALGRLDGRQPRPRGPGRGDDPPRADPAHARAGAASGTNGAGITARVLDHVYYGPDTVVRLSLDGAARMIVKARTFDHEVPASASVSSWRCSARSIVFPARRATTRGAGSSSAPRHALRRARRAAVRRVVAVAAAAAAAASARRGRSCSTTASIRR